MEETAKHEQAPGPQRVLDRLGRRLAAVPLPGPSPQFRRRAWTAFQRALDPLARPRPLPRRPR